MLVYVYPLADPGLIAARAQPLLAQLKAGLRDRPGQVEFALSPASGCFRFFDVARLWKNGNGGGLPKTAADAARTATDYFKAANREALRYRTAMKLAASEYPNPFPVDALRHVASKPVYAHGASAPDHWLSLWMAWLPVKGPPAAPDDAAITAPVHGAGVEVRIGAGGQVLGLVSTLRTWTGRAAVDAFEPPPSADGTTPDLLFLMEGSGEPQRFIAPYFRRRFARSRRSRHRTETRLRVSLIARIGVTIVGPEHGADRASWTGAGNSHRWTATGTMRCPRFASGWIRSSRPRGRRRRRERRTRADLGRIRWANARTDGPRHLPGRGRGRALANRRGTHDAAPRDRCRRRPAGRSVAKAIA